MKVTLQMTGYSLLAVIGIILSPVMLVIYALVIFVAGTVAAVSFIIDIPIKQRRQDQLQELVKNVVDHHGKCAYLWYSRNSKTLSDYLENHFIPKYKEHLIVEYGDDIYVNDVDSQYTDLVAGLKEFSLYGQAAETSSQCGDTDEPAKLYILDKSETIQYMWPALVAQGDDDGFLVDISSTARLFELKIDAAIDPKKKPQWSFKK